MERTAGRHDRARRAIWPVVLLTLTGAALAIRIASIAEPLGIDQSLWASAAAGMSQGQLLYVDVWEQRPPGIYLTYLLAFTLFGWTTAAMAWIDIAASAITAALLWALGYRLSGRLTGAMAAALYAVFTIPAGLYGYGGFLERAVCETFIVACIGAAALCAARVRAGTAAAAGLGLFCGLAIVYKPNAALYLPALIAWMVFYRSDPNPHAGSITRVATAAIAVSALPSLAIIAWLWQNGSLQDARTAVIDFNRWYVAAGFEPAAYAVAFAEAVWFRMKTNPIWAAGSITSVAALWHLTRARALPPVAGLALLWGAATVGVIVVNGARLFNSYFMQAFAPLCLMAAWFFTDARWASSRSGRIARYATVAAMVFVLARGGYATKVWTWTHTDVAALTGRTDPTEYLHQFGGYANERGYSARANDELSAYVRAHTRPDERVFLFGINGAGVYFLADRLSAHRFLRVNFFYPDDFPDPSFTLGTVTRELADRRPRYIIFENLHTTSAIGRAMSGVADDPHVRDLLAAYDRETEIEDFTLYRRRD